MSSAKLGLTSALSVVKKKSGRGSDPFLFPFFLGRSKNLCSQGAFIQVYLSQLSLPFPSQWPLEKLELSGLAQHLSEHKDPSIIY